MESKDPPPLFRTADLEKEWLINEELLYHNIDDIDDHNPFDDEYKSRISV